MRDLFDAEADAPPVHRLEGERFEHEQVDAAAEGVGFLRMAGHGTRSLEVERRVLGAVLLKSRGLLGGSQGFGESAASRSIRPMGEIRHLKTVILLSSEPGDCSREVTMTWGCADFADFADWSDKALLGFCCRGESCSRRATTTHTSLRPIRPSRSAKSAKSASSKSHRSQFGGSLDTAPGDVTQTLDSVAAANAMAPGS